MPSGGLRRSPLRSREIEIPTPLDLVLLGAKLIDSHLRKNPPTPPSFIELMRESRFHRDIPIAILNGGKAEHILGAAALAKSVSGIFSLSYSDFSRPSLNRSIFSFAVMVIMSASFGTSMVLCKAGVSRSVKGILPLQLNQFSALRRDQVTVGLTGDAAIAQAIAKRSDRQPARLLLPEGTTVSSDELAMLFQRIGAVAKSNAASAGTRPDKLSRGRPRAARQANRR